MFRIALLLFALVPALGAREFDPRRDAFAFSNDTVLNYEVTADGRLLIGNKPKSGKPTHCCFLFTRSAMQFWKFARFEPGLRKLPEEEYRKRLGRLFTIPPWAKREERIVFPGYADLWSFSERHEDTIRAELGSWLLTYLRVGNWRMMNPIIRLMQGHFAEKLFAAVSRGEIRAMYLAKFPHMNHVVLVYHAERLPDGRMRFRTYDANYAGKSARLDYVPASKLFDFERRFYWPGGELRAFPVYDRPLH
jgi:hypothetical protein